MAAPRGRTFATMIGLAVFLAMKPLFASPFVEPLKLPDTQLEPITWAMLDDWTLDDHAAAFTAFLTSCKAQLSNKKAARTINAFNAALRSVCSSAVAVPYFGEVQARQFFEDHFRPVRISRLGEGQGFLTGYYEPIVEGSRFPTREFTVPMYRRPQDLVAIGSNGTGSFPNKAEARRKTVNGDLVPYYDRGEIEDGALDGRHLEICWLKDSVAAFFIQIQGSAQVRLEDGLIVHLNYDAHTGYRYTPVGRILIERNIVPRNEMSLERIRQWMLDNPDQAQELRRHNQSFVFFRIAGLGDRGEALGGEGVPLSPGRSIAVDRALHHYGTPFWIDAQLPIESATSQTVMRRLMIAQDTGSAIIGPARADIFFGAGDTAGQIAGRIRHPGRFVMLVPNEIDPVAAGAHMPVPKPRPDFEKISHPELRVKRLRHVESAKSPQ